MDLVNYNNSAHVRQKVENGVADQRSHSHRDQQRHESAVEAAEPHDGHRQKADDTEQADHHVAHHRDQPH